MITPRIFLHTEIKVKTRHLPSGIPSLRWGNAGCVSILPPLCFLVGRGRWLWFRAALVLLSVENGLVGRGLWEEVKAFPETKTKGVDMENVPIILYFCLACVLLLLDYLPLPTTSECIYRCCSKTQNPAPYLHEMHEFLLRIHPFFNMLRTPCSRKTHFKQRNLK